MAKPSIPASTERLLTPEEKEKFAQDLLAALKKETGGRSLIQDELDADFLKKVTKSLNGATTKMVDVSHIASQTPEKVVDIACADGEPLLQVKGDTNSEARLALAHDLLESVNLVVSEYSNSAEDLPFANVVLVQHAVSTADALLKAELRIP